MRYRQRCEKCDSELEPIYRRKRDIGASFIRLKDLNGKGVYWCEKCQNVY